MTILYVSNQEASRIFYESVFQIPPILDVPGMTEFRMEGGFILGLMSIEGIKRLLGKDVFPKTDEGNPRVELYLRVGNAQHFLDRAIQNGAELLLKVSMQDWGDRVGYCLDPDRHVLAFAETTQ
ncbi:MAG: glyoxalase [Candidatus Marinimicrobia bacterium]|nr:glyoxalase [Candidatus Neomarinimicrobiota bacterium]